MNRRFDRGQGTGARRGFWVLGSGFWEWWPGSASFSIVSPKTENRKPKTPIYNGVILLLLAIVLLASGCGKRMTPYAPDRVLPAAVRNFTLTQEGGALVLGWQLPRENLLGQPLTQVQGCQVYRAATKGVSPEALASSDFVLYADIDLAYPQRGEVQGEALLFKDRELTPDQRYYYRVAAYDQDGYKGAWSRTLSHVWGWLPRAPGGFKAAPGDKIVSLSWEPVTDLQDGSKIPDLVGYLIYRRSGQGSWIRVTPQPVLQAQFQDVAVLNDVEYTYKVVAVRRVGDDLLASQDSATQMAKPEKRTPPPPVVNFLAVPTDQGVELRWELSPFPDVAGYRVYRRLTGEEKFTRLTPELVTKPYFVDSQVSRGRTYHYYVTAVDDSPRANESMPSETISILY